MGYGSENLIIKQKLEDASEAQRVANAPAHEKAVQNVQAWRNPGRGRAGRMGIVPRLHEAL